MFRSAGKYILEKIGSTFAGRVVKYGFWSAVFFFGPGPIIATVGVPALAVAAVAAHSGLIEYGAGKAASKIISTE